MLQDASGEVVIPSKNATTSQENYIRISGPSTIAGIYRARPEPRDPDVVLALEKLIAQYTREKKKLPALPMTFSEKSRVVFQAIQETCELRMDKDATDS